MPGGGVVSGAEVLVLGLSRRGDPEALPARHPGRLAGVALLAVLLAYGGLCARVDDHLSRHASISGVAVGGLTRAAAAQRVADQLGPRSRRVMTVYIGGRRSHVFPARSGLAIDPAASVDRAGGTLSLHPGRVWRALQGGSATEVVVVVDDQRFRRTVSELAASVEPVSTVAHPSHGSMTHPPEPAEAPLDQEAALAALRRAYLGPNTPVVLPLVRPSRAPDR